MTTPLDPGLFGRLVRDATADWRPTPPPLATIHARARRRQRRRTFLAVASTVLIVAGTATGVTLASTGPSRQSLPPAVSRSTSTVPTSAPMSQVPTATPSTLSPPPSNAGAVLKGTFDVGTIAFADNSSGLAAIIGQAGDTGPTVSWFERTSDGGQRWTAGPISNAVRAPSAAVRLIFANGQDGWAYGGGLFFTTDGGRSWREVPGAPPLTEALAIAGTSTWVAGGCAQGSCPSTLYQADSVGGRLTKLAHQPTTTENIDQIARPSASVAWLLLDDGHGRQQLSTTADGGDTWANRALPCPANTVGVNIAGPSTRALWAICQLQTQSTCQGCGVDVIYRSADAGRTWTRMTPEHLPNQTLSRGLSVYVAGDSTAWAIQNASLADEKVLRTTDGGRSWRVVLASLQTAQTPISGPFMITLATRGTDIAWLVAYTADAAGRTFQVVRTTDGGRTWHPATLPAPSGLGGK